jgi:hypothetical protein
MDWQTLRRTFRQAVRRPRVLRPSVRRRPALRQIVARVALPGLLAGALLVLPAGPLVANAQGPMDIGIVLPSFSDLPLSVEPGQSFPLVASTAPGAECVGHVTFRGFPTADLDPQTATDGTCAWTVAVPQNAMPGTATLGVDISRSGQGWSLAGVVYVSPVGGSPAFGG